MDIDEIVKGLNEIFAQDLPEFYKRRIVFWYDEASQYENDFEDVVLAPSVREIRKVAVTDKNSFEVKKLLCADDTSSDFLVYTNMKENLNDKDWLTDIKLYSEEFRSDKVDFWIKDMHIVSTPGIRQCFVTYSKFLNSKERRNKILSQKKVPQNERDISLAIIGVITGEQNATFANLMWKVIVNSLLEDGSYLQEMKNYEIDKFFWETVKRLGYNSDVPSVQELVKYVFLTAFSKNVPAEYLSSLDSYIQPVFAGTCFDIVADWRQTKEFKQFKQISNFVEGSIGLEKILNGLSIQDLLPAQFFGCINIIILYKLMEDISNDIKNVEEIKQALLKRKPLVWHEQDSYYFESLSILIEMWNFQKQHALGFHTMEPEKVWSEYINEYYKMDMYYRLFHVNASKILKNESEILGDLYKSVIEKVDNLYNNWFLKELSSNWTKASKDQLAANGYIEGVKLQKNFYNNYVKYRETKKIAVLISDAMRYEIAVSLRDKLYDTDTKTKAKIDLENMQAIFPTVTQFGMTALLPQKKITAELKNNDKAEIKVFADGNPAVSTLDREKIIQLAHQPSRAVKANDLIKWTTKQREDEVGGVEILYIYHDTIDQAGHDGLVFNASETAITEIENIVGILKNLNFSSIIITSDHGFLCTNKNLTLDEKLSNKIPANDIVQIGRRYVIAKPTAEPEYMFSVKFFDQESGLVCFTPYENVRISLHSTNSEKFVHGGASLQEMVVPVLLYHTVRTDSSEYKNRKEAFETKPVEIGLLSSNHKIVNLSFNIQFYQKEAVGGLKTKAEYKLYFKDQTGSVLSDEQRIVADSTNTNEQERKFNVRFKLKSQKYEPQDSFYLVIENVNGGTPQEIPYQIDIATSVDGFDFFN